MMGNNMIAVMRALTKRLCSTCGQHHRSQALQKVIL
jgi:hypothetical protein